MNALPVVNPPFNLYRRFATETVPPPFSFEVTMHVLPLAADPRALKRFCDNYLNVAPGFVRFAPAAPFVLLTITHYSRARALASGKAFLSTNELNFAIPLEWYDVADGQPKFRDYAQFSPYIFVDDDGSEIEGREVYGWPKVSGWIDKQDGPWIRAPRSPETLLVFNTDAFDKLYAPSDTGAYELLRVERLEPEGLSVFPPGAAASWNPWVNMARATTGWSNWMTSWLSFAGGQAQRLCAGDGPTPQQWITTLNGLATTNTINLKQLRDAERPELACYQALTNGHIDLKEFHQGGLLGENALLNGDLSGGYQVWLRELHALPIVETLGLGIEGRRTERGRKEVLLRPLLPYYQDLRLEYQRGENLCWRSRGTQGALWRDHQRREKPKKGSPPQDGPIYVTAGSEQHQVAEPPFDFKDIGIRVLPLLADKEKLKRLLEGDHQPDDFPDDHFAMFGQIPPEIIHVEPWGDYVFLLMVTMGPRTKTQRIRGGWQGKNARFAIPVKLYRRDSAGELQLQSVGLVSPFVYADRADVGSTTSRELLGWPTTKARMEAPLNSWMTVDGPYPERVPLIQLRANLPPKLDAAVEFEWVPIFEVVDGFPVASDDQAAWSTIAEGYGSRLKGNVEQQNALAEQDPEAFQELKALALEFLVNGALNQLSLKQFRDTEQPRHACYQAAVNSRWLIEELDEVSEMTENLHVHIWRRQTQPIVDLLGLDVKYSQETPEGLLEAVQAVRPFTVRANLSSIDLFNVCFRSGSLSWALEPAEKGRSPGLDFFTPEGTGTRFGTAAVAHVNEEPATNHAGSRFAEKARQWEEQTSTAPGGVGLTPKRARQIIEQGFQPQSAINAVLSDGWLRNEPKNTRDVAATFPPFLIRTDTVGTEHAALFPADECLVGKTNLEYWSAGKAK